MEGSDRSRDSSCANWSAELARMLALADARLVSAEQMTCRRKIEMDIEPVEEERAA
ncbi:hypothetical protein GOB19_00490 [Sinorhizobium meliloti]|nr:hypothetical protein [Sinorhizobium meliloti]MDX0303509.1 hypothetical protein [Sinorhizobium meliloti]